MSIEQPPSRPSNPGADDARAPSSGWLQVLRARLGLQGTQTLRETLEAALAGDGERGSAFTAEEREMLLRLLRFGAMRVDDVMVPRADIIAADETETVAEVLATFVEAGVSRIPLFHETLDDPRGMVHVKDLLGWLAAAGQSNGLGNGLGNAATPAPPASSMPPASLKPPALSPAPSAAPAQSAPPTAPAVAVPVDAQPAPAPATPDAAAVLLAQAFAKADLNAQIGSTKLRRPVLYVPPSMPAMNLLIRMQSTRNHMAIVVDEYGGTDGLVTIEDLVELIVGDIEDEHDEADASLIGEDPKLGLVASARTPVDELEERLGLKLLTEEEADEIDTLGGLVFSIVGRVPARGELVRHPSGVEFEVLDADPRRVKKLRIHVRRSEGEAAPPPIVGDKP